MGKTARTDHPRLTPIQQRLLDTADDIAATGPDELVYQHSVACQCAMPASRQKGALSWTRQQGRAILQMEAGKVLNPRTGEFEQLELPYGPKPRLILMHLNGEAIRRQSPVIPVEDSMTAFFRRLMGRTQDGRQVRMLKHQLSALAAATIRLGIADGERAMQVNTQIVSAFDLWMERDERQRVLWPTALRLSLDYYDSLTRYAVPLDERAIAALSKSATALDVYCWLAQRLHRIPDGKPQFVPWPRLHEQFGQGYDELRFFRRFFLAQLRQVQAAYPDARTSIDGRGMTLEHSLPPVTKRMIRVQSVTPIDQKDCEC
jgi:hypothetical protein